MPLSVHRVDSECHIFYDQLQPAPAPYKDYVQLASVLLTFLASQNYRKLAQKNQGQMLAADVISLFSIYERTNNYICE